MYKVKELAEKLNVSESWINKKIKEDKIKVVWFGGVRRVTETELERIKTLGVE